MSTTVELTPRVSKLSAAMLRRLRQAHERSWLTRVLLSSCHHSDGCPETVNVRQGTCIIANPNLVQPRIEYHFAEICDVTLHLLWLVSNGTRSACLAQVAPWMVTGDDAEHVHTDVVNGAVTCGLQTTVLLPYGGRRMGTVTAIAGVRVQLRLQPVIVSGPPIGWHAPTT